MRILPMRYVKIRRYGIYNPTVKRNLQLIFVPQEKPDIDVFINKKQAPESNQERFKRLTGIDIFRCPVCKKGKMIILRELPRIRASDLYLFVGKNINKNNNIN
jgi:hypothetical protein